MDKEQCLKLIQLYGGYRRFWDAQCPDYTNRRLREDTWRKISQEMNLPIAELKKKMDSLLGSYRREKSREKKSRITGSGRGEIYVSNWYAYEAFSFLGDRNHPGIDTEDILEQSGPRGRTVPCGGRSVLAGSPPPLAAQLAPAMDMEHFIEAVRRYPCLWNTSAPGYRDQELKDAAWADLVRETDLTSVKEVKLKWKKLRDSYRDALKRQSEMAAGGKRGSAWKYTHLMHFLQPHMNARKKPPFAPAPREPSADAAEGANGHEPSDDSCSSRSSTPRRRRERPAPAKRPPSPRHLELPDPLDIFFNSMCQSTKRLPYPAQIRIKKALFAAVIEAEEGLLAEQQSYAALWASGAASSSGSEPAAQQDDVKPYARVSADKQFQ